MVILLLLAGTALMFAGMKRIKLDMTVEGWFKKDDPIIVAFNGFHEEFGSEDNLYIVYKPKDGDVFSEQSLRIVKGIQDELMAVSANDADGGNSALKHVVKVNSLINAPISTVEDDVLNFRPLVGDEVPSSAAELAGIRRTAESQHKLSLLYFSEDARYGGMLVETDFGAIREDEDQVSAQALQEANLDPAALRRSTETEGPVRFKNTDVGDYVALMTAVDKILSQPKYADHMEFHPVGQTAIMPPNLELLKEMGTLYMITFLVMIAILWGLFRSLSAVAWSISIVVMSTIWTLGLSGWLGLTASPLMMIAIMFILVYGMADAIHILSGYLFFRRAGHDHRLSLRFVYRDSGFPCILTAVTTLFGIVGLNMTPIVPVKVFALMAAMGVGLALFFTIFMLPLLLDLWAPEKSTALSRMSVVSAIGNRIPRLSALVQKYLEGTLPFAEKHRYAITAFTPVLLIACVIGATRLKVDSNPLGQFPPETRVVKDAALVDEKMMGSQNMEIFFDMGEPDAFYDPAVLKAMDALQQRIDEKYRSLVIRTSSLADVIKDSYRKLNSGNQDMFIIPGDRGKLSQTIFLYNNSNSEDRRRLVSDDYSRAHITVQLKNTGSYEYTGIFNQMKQDMEEFLQPLKARYPQASISHTGMLTLMMTGVDHTVTGEIQGFVLAFIAVNIILLLVFGSVKAGLIAMIPNIVPTFLTFGLMGWLKIPMDFNTMMLAPMIIGIAVDDTIHFVSHYKKEVLQTGDIKASLRSTMKQTGQAICITTMLLGFGFGVMAFSAYTGTRNLGIFGSLSLFTALVFELYLLPAAIMIFNFDFGFRKNASKPKASVPAAELQGASA